MGIQPNTAILLITFVCLLITVLTGSKSEDVDKWEATVKALESLVRKNPAATREVKYCYDLGYKRAVVLEALSLCCHEETKHASGAASQADV